MMLLCDKIGPCCNNWGKISHTSPPNGSYLSNNVSLNLSKRLLAILKPLNGGVTKKNAIKMFSISKMSEIDLMGGGAGIEDEISKENVNALG